MSNRRNNASPMNINQTNRILPPNMMNINIVRPGMLGKRRRVNNRNNASNRPQKRSDLTMIAEIGKVTPDKINIKLPRRIVNELRDLNKKSSRNRWEYGGKIEFRPNTNGSMVKFNNPQRFTSQLRNAISTETFQLMQNSYISYHTHPTAYTPNNLKNNTAMNLNYNSRKILVTLPSGADMEAYIGTYPTMQANMISDENGYYVIDLIETTGREKPNAVEVNRTMEWLRTQPFFNNRYRSLGGYEYFETTLTDWKRSINQEINPFLQRLFGISIKYYGYNDEPAIITLART
jgi:hypothetical protein